MNPMTRFHSGILTPMAPTRRRTVIATPTRRPSAASIGKKLAADGASPEEIRGTLAAGAGERHEARVLDTLTAAFAVRFPDTKALGIDLTADLMKLCRGEPPANLTIQAADLLEPWALIDLDLGGHGGEGGSGANGDTTRLPPFRLLGEGRWRAYEGRVWRSAATEARKRLEHALATRSVEPRWVVSTSETAPYAAATRVMLGTSVGEEVAAWNPTPGQLSTWAPWFGALKVRLLRLPF